MNILFLFLDGVGLGSADPKINPFAEQLMPTLQDLIDGHQLVDGPHLPVIGERASLLALDACMGVSGFPQSATGQATLLTGENVPSQLGYHYGPKPNPPIRELLSNGNLFSRLSRDGYECAFLNAYPPRYFEAIESGRRMYSAIPMAVMSAGIQLKNIDDLIAGRALSADFTARGWHEHLGLPETPKITEIEAGRKLRDLSKNYHFALFEYWLSDYAGHKQDISQARELLASFDQVLAGLIDDWHGEDKLIILTSDHGNIEDLRTRRHTLNPVPALLIGSHDIRNLFIHYMYSSIYPAKQLNLTCIAPAIIALLQDRLN